MARELPLLRRTRERARATVLRGDRQEPTAKIMRTHFAMRADHATRDRISNRARRIACAITIAAVLGGCSAGSKNQGDSRDSKEFASKPMSAEACSANASIQDSATQDADYRIQSGDQLMLDFYMNSEFNDNATVDPNGKIVLRMVGPIQAAGLTPAQLASSI